ncbi:MAG: hypothetical protein HY646_15115, partial [Acidobacteria bacterium]|nr:hypothetical protein [Acidobacteriota bacterium]
SSGLETLSRVRAVAPSTPIVVLTGLDDEAQALEALKGGAQDYLIKGKLDSGLLIRAIRYAIERHRMEQRLLQAQKLEAVGTLANGVAHNFNNMLAIILGYCDVMLDQHSSDPHLSKQLTSIKKVAQRATLLTRQLFTFSNRRRAESEVADLNKIVLDMNVLIESMLGRNIKLRIDLTPDPVSIHSGSSDIQQMIMALVLNARDAMPGGGDLLIQTARTAAEVSLRISDTGCGMSNEVRTHIFEPFFTTKGLVNASGLGLSTVYGLMKQIGGAVHVTSNPGLGAIFTLTFPAAGAGEQAGEITEVVNERDADRHVRP